jgi:hypothetical protein
MNAKDIAKALKCCYALEGNGFCDGCPYIEYHAGDLIESLLAQLDAAIAGQETLQKALIESQRREMAAVEDLSTYKDCGFCIHVEDQQYCYKNCQRHIDVDNFRTHPCWQWRGPQEGEGNAETDNPD